MPLAADVSGRGERLVLVHGFTQTGRSWEPIRADLAADHEVVVVDAPGHGRSGHADADLETGASLLGATGGRATYVGYSMGGRLALHLALGRPDLVRRLVVLGATAGIADEAERAARRTADEALAADLERNGLDPFLTRWLASPLFAGLPDDPAERAARRTNAPAALAASLRHAGTGTQAPLWDQLSTLTMPVLALAGEHDRRFAALARRLAAAIGPSATAALVPGAGHAAHLEQPTAFLAVLRAWLAAHPAP